jgi:hypothetical protein
MSIKPLDLQTMFVRMNEVSKTQSQTQQAAALQQSDEARKLAQQELMQDSSVPATKEGKEAQKVDEKEHGSGNKEESRPNTSSPKDEEKKKKTIVQDPEMGTHIDISG